MASGSDAQAVDQRFLRCRASPLEGTGPGSGDFADTVAARWWPGRVEEDGQSTLLGPGDRAAPARAGGAPSGWSWRFVPSGSGQTACSIWASACTSNEQTRTRQDRRDSLAARQGSLCRRLTGRAVLQAGPSHPSADDTTSTGDHHARVGCRRLSSPNVLSDGHGRPQRGAGSPGSAPARPLCHARA